MHLVWKLRKILRISKYRGYGQPSFWNMTIPLKDPQLKTISFVIQSRYAKDKIIIFISSILVLMSGRTFSDHIGGWHCGAHGFTWKEFLLFLSRDNWTHTSWLVTSIKWVHISINWKKTRFIVIIQINNSKVFISIRLDRGLVYHRMWRIRNRRIRRIRHFLPAYNIWRDLTKIKVIFRQ